jgi:hypothetical protein
MDIPMGGGQLALAKEAFTVAGNHGTREALSEWLRCHSISDSDFGQQINGNSAGRSTGQPLGLAGPEMPNLSREEKLMPAWHRSLSGMSFSGSNPVAPTCRFAAS